MHDPFPHGIWTHFQELVNMQTKSGQRILCVTALLLVTIFSSTRLSVEKAAARGTDASLSRTACKTPRPCSRNFHGRKTLMTASWYGKKFQGRLTSSGETFDLHKLTAANKSLPLGSLVILTAPSTGRSVVVRINDRGPWLKGRDFDLSEAAAAKLGIH
jgi:hypothetical protein